MSRLIRLLDNVKHKHSHKRRIGLFSLIIFFGLLLLLVADAGVEGFSFFGIACVREDVTNVLSTDAALGIAGTPSLHIAFKRFVIALLQSDAECRNTLFVGKPQSALKLLPRVTYIFFRKFL